MKTILFRTVSVLAILALMLGAFTACDNTGDDKADGALDNGNVITVKEEGTEKESFQSSILFRG